jgi:hypothetical protein
MPVTAAGNRRRQHWAAIIEEVSHLLLQIDLDRSLCVQRNGCAEKDRYPKSDLHTVF